MVRPMTRHAFSLLELLVVVAIVGLLAVLAVPGVSSTLEAQNISRAGRMVADELALARQEAMTRNRHVEVRIVKIPKPDGPIWGGFQSWILNSSGAEPLTRATRLPESIMIADAVGLSPILHAANFSKNRMPFPQSSGELEYVAIRFSPSGGLNPIPANPAEPYFTIVKETHKGTQAPPNYLTILINPATGRTTLFQP
jgi:uncharacterized protein (TIGR02596 family)